MRVVATEFGFYIGRRRVGDVFDVPEGTTAKWFRPVDVPALLAPEPAPEAAKPRGKKTKPAADLAGDLA
ncbi:MAG: hypothetical protein KAX46_00135 [Chromatiaceae bacterium]|nr:hypothetical protein [Chromatiaceae bacterium]